jgi:hypothetical protein
MGINTAIIAKKYLQLFLYFGKEKREPELPLFNYSTRNLHLEILMHILCLVYPFKIDVKNQD